MPKKPTQKQQRSQDVLKYLEAEYGNATCALNHKNALQLLLATILSAQCTDERVNIVTKDLFKTYKKVKDFADAPIQDLEQVVRSTGFFRNKAKSIKGCCQRLVEHYNCKVPDQMEDLLTLPGVARKTANVLLGTWYKKNEGVVVDTHVKRITTLLGLTKQTTPEKIEQDLIKLLPRDQWTNYSHRLIWHGRKICNARKPKCPECKMNTFCPAAKK